jgi:hypothetical protein
MKGEGEDCLSQAIFSLSNDVSKIYIDKGVVFLGQRKN